MYEDLNQNIKISYWERAHWFSKTDLLVIGGGISGLSTAISAKERYPMLKITVVEALSFGNMASTKNAGFACFGSAGEILKDLSQLGRDQVIDLIRFRYGGLHILKKRLGTKEIGYKHTGGVELFHQTDQAKFQGIIDELPALNQLMYEATGLKHTYSSVDIGMLSDYLLPLSIRNAYEGELNPVLMMDALYTKAITMGVHIFKGVRVLNLDHEKHLGLLDNGEHIHFDKAVICTNSLARQFYPELDVSPAPNYVMYAYCPHDIGWKSCYHMHDGYVYFRRIDSEFILIGGGRHILEHPMTDSEASKNQILSYLNNQLRQLIPKADFRIKGYWKGYLGVGAERMPIISEVEQDIYCAVRLGGMGVAIGSFLGNAVTQLINY